MHRLLFYFFEFSDSFLCVLCLFTYLVTLVSFFSLFNVILLTDFLISQNVFLYSATFIAIVHYIIFFRVLNVCVLMSGCVSFDVS